MNKGFASTGILYTILIISLVLLTSVLSDLQNKKSILDNIKSETVEAVDDKLECSYAEEEITLLKNKYNTLNNTYQELMKQLELTNTDKSEILDGKIAYSKGNLLVGIMPNNGTLSSNLNAGQSYTIPAGYTTGGTVKANSLASQTSATAKAENVVEGYTAWVNGNKITGTNKGYTQGYADGNQAGYDEAYNNAMHGTATASSVLTGKTFTSTAGVGVVGTMPNNGTLSSNLNAGGSFTIPAGYTTGGTVTANSLASQTSATATAADISSGKTAYVNGTKITGTMTSQTATQVSFSYTPTKDETALLSMTIGGRNTKVSTTGVAVKYFTEDGVNLIGISGQAEANSISGATLGYWSGIVNLKAGKTYSITISTNSTGTAIFSNHALYVLG
ncbi:MAG: hypothetical protein PHN42_05535 [Bacilli bacterium]|nr:hypothetical protein [Bacilli bacterium]